MKSPKAEASEITDSVIKEKTGRTLKQWYAELDKRGGLEAGRRELTNHLHTAGKLDEWCAVTIAVEYEKDKGQVEQDGKPKGYSICATKTIAAPLGEVFTAFGEAKALDGWLGPKTRVEFEDGGKLENGDGNRATFTRIRANKDLRIAWEGQPAPGTQVEVLFTGKGKGKTGITLNHTRIPTRREADELRASWGAAFDALKGLLETAKAR